MPRVQSGEMLAFVKRPLSEVFSSTGSLIMEATPIAALTAFSAHPTTRNKLGSSKHCAVWLSLARSPSHQIADVTVSAASRYLTHHIGHPYSALTL